MENKRRRGAVLEQDLLDAAWAELAAHGYERLSFDAVAARAGTSKPVVYRRWPGKPELVQAAFRQMMARNPITVPDTGSLREDVIGLLRQVNDRRTGLAAVLIAQLGDVYRATGASLDDLRASLATGPDTAMREILERATARGEADLTRLSERVIQLPVDLFRHQILLTARPVPEADIAEIVDTVFLPLVSAGSPRS